MTYDDDGRVTKRDVPEGEINYEYDSKDRLSRTYTGINPAAPVTATVTATDYVYNKLGRPGTARVVARDGVQLSIPQQEETTYAYDPLNGSLQQVTAPNGVITLYTYDLMDHADSVTHYAPDATPLTLADNPVLAAFTYTFYDDGRAQAVTETRPEGTTTVTGFTTPLDG